jgi:hypothetical protein
LGCQQLKPRPTRLSLLQESWGAWQGDGPMQQEAGPLLLPLPHSQPSVSHLTSEQRQRADYNRQEALRRLNERRQGSSTLPSVVGAAALADSATSTRAIPALRSVFLQRPTNPGAGDELPAPTAVTPPQHPGYRQQYQHPPAAPAHPPHTAPRHGGWPQLTPSRTPTGGFMQHPPSASASCADKAAGSGMSHQPRGFLFRPPQGVLPASF